MFRVRLHACHPFWSSQFLIREGYGEERTQTASSSGAPGSAVHSNWRRTVGGQTGCVCQNVRVVTNSGWLQWLEYGRRQSRLRRDSFPLSKKG